MIRSLITATHARVAVFALLLALAACSYPETRVETIDARPTIAIANAAAGTMLVVNGVVIGPAQDFDGNPKTLRLGKGTHLVEIRSNGAVVYSETVFLADDTHRTVTVRY